MIAAAIFLGIIFAFALGFVCGFVAGVYDDVAERRDRIADLERWRRRNVAIGRAARAARKAS